MICGFRSHRPRDFLPLHQPVHIVDEVHQADLHLRPGNADGADEFVSHRVFLKTEHMLDPGPYFRAGLVGFFLSLSELRRFTGLVLLRRAQYH